MISKELRVNDRIRARQVRLIAPDGEQLGIVSLQEALQKAEEYNLDLVEVSAAANPPVCRIMDYGKYRYEQQKREREARKKQKTITVKEVKFRPNIEEHDFQVKVRNAKRFLLSGNKVKCTVRFRGREIVHKELGRRVLERFAASVGEVSKIERQPEMEGRTMVMVLTPKQEKQEKPEPQGG